MQIHDNKAAQLNVARDFLSKNRKIILLAVFLLAGVLFGWNYWQSTRLNSLTQTAVVFEQINQDLSADGPDALNEIESFISKNTNSYGVFAALKLAQYLVKKTDYANAQSQLESALNQTKDPDLLALVNLRIARLQMQQQQADEALQTLEKISEFGWLAQRQELKGDILVSQGKLAQAQNAYTEGMKLNLSPAYQSSLRAKLNTIVT